MKFSEISRKKVPAKEPLKDPQAGAKTGVPPQKTAEAAPADRETEAGGNRVSFTKLEPQNRTSPTPPSSPTVAAGSKAASVSQKNPSTATNPDASGSPPQDLKEQRQAAHELYGRAIRAIQAVVNSESPALASSEAMRQTAQELLDCLCSGNQAILALVAASTASNYLYAHLVNVAILTMHVGLGLRWDQDDLVLLGITALLHDLGVAQPKDSSATERELNEERGETQSHTPSGTKVLEHLEEIQKTENEVFASLAGRTRELGRNEGPSRSAQIIGICDVYEAMSHARPWREPLIPHDVLRAFIRVPVPGLDERLVKFFIERMSLFPPGSYVLLSTGEIGLVAGINPHLPTRPFLEICIRPDGARESPPVLTNLGDKPIVHVVRAIDETKLNLKDKRLLLHFQAARWWTE